MSRVADRVTPSISKGEKIPPLQNGDHLTREEFERRFDAMPNLKKAELIEGVVYVDSPVPFMGHGVPHSNVAAILGTYRAATPGVVAVHSGSVRIDLDNMPQPDVSLFVVPSYGGQAKIDADDYVNGRAELVAEITATSASYDLHEKMHVYRRSGVREYLVWRTLDGQFDYFVLQNGDFQRLAPAGDGVFHSPIFPGLWLNVTALLKDDLAAALQTLQQGIASSEHQTFAKALRDRAAKKQL